MAEAGPNEYGWHRERSSRASAPGPGGFGKLADFEDKLARERELRHIRGRQPAPDAGYLAKQSGTGRFGEASGTQGAEWPPHEEDS